MEFSLSWVIDGKGGHTRSFNFLDVDKYLTLLSDSSGSDLLLVDSLKCACYNLH